MDYKEKIKKAAQIHYDLVEFENSNYKESFIIGALSDEAKAYWYNEFKQEQIARIDTIINHHYPDKKEDLLDNDGTPELYQKYLKDNPDRPISFDNWQYMMDNYNKVTKESLEEVMKNIKQPYFMNEDGTYTLCNPDGSSKAIVSNFKWIDKAEWDAERNHIGVDGVPFAITLDEDWHNPFDEELINDIMGKPRIGIIGHVDNGPQFIHVRARNIGKTLMSSIEQIPFELGGLGQAHHKGVIAIVPDQKSMDYASEITRMIVEDASVQKIMVITRDQLQSDKVIKFMDGNLPDHSIIKYIVPIADVNIEQIQKIESDILDVMSIPKPWDTKKQKKDNHKRNNKRK